MSDDKARAQQMRHLAGKLGLIVTQSREHAINAHNRGEFRLMDGRNRVIAGARYDLTLDTLEKALTAEQTNRMTIMKKPAALSRGSPDR
jgi:hypothetical protein